MKLGKNRIHDITEDLNSWIGDVPASALKGFFTKKGTKQQMIQDLFIKDFTDDALTSLLNAIPMIVDPELDSTVEKKKANRRARNAAKKNAKTPSTTVTEDYSKLDMVFESILAEAATKQTISDYMSDWFNLYMSGVDWTANPNNFNNVKQAINNIETVYRTSKGNKNKVKQAINSLGQMAFALAKSSPKIPAGMKDELQRMKSRSQEPKGASKPEPKTTNTPASPSVTLEKVKADIEDLAKNNPTEYAELLKSILKSVGAKTQQ